MPKAIFEVCAFNLQSCLIAEQAGAYRVELCDNPTEGGTTPSYGTIKRTREKLSIKLYPILRPRAGNYYYDDDEISIIHEDIRVCRELGCDGISIGAQQRDGRIDKELMKEFVERAGPMGVTCNRAFDATPDMFQALEDLIDVGCERVLTSGQASTAPEAGKRLGELVKAARDRIIVMPGAGIRSSNIGQLMEESGAKEYHGSVRRPAANVMTHGNPHVLDAGNVYFPDKQELAIILEKMK
ncbi:copper homeostasis protein CutC [Stigmatella aurantiaca]|uniref:PF03932 family protein CutC n=1 Tax=Stigmatella aurantiaca (strain DW4/3-1) TaxID=378806 RepID=Q096S5_STIAD|nr:copper homeostasis protein CutC [Stigmatella aurantiaca]ADO68550.1 Copper homeostasis protein [Stigmatella aurantiaca DW4/3-1]EAU67695.1 copper homeostasis protein CutC [Stigmatella aurantiaca DW4/3-1]